MSKTLEIIARFQGERVRWPISDPECEGDYTLIGTASVAESSADDCRAAGVDPEDPLTIKGTANDEDIERGGTYRFFGTWSRYFNRYHGQNETQFVFRSFVRHVPHDPEGVADYLSSAGRGYGIGPRKAMDLVKAHGVDAVLRVCRENVGAVMECTKITIDNATMFAAKLQEQAATEHATLEVDRILNGRGFPRTTARKAIKVWGNRAAEVIAESPYILMQFRGVGFRLADRLWRELGKDPRAIERQTMCLWHAIASNNDGHTWFPVESAIREMSKVIGGEIDPRAAILAAKKIAESDPNAHGAIVTARTEELEGVLTDGGPCLWLAEGKNAAAEDSVAKNVAKAVLESMGGHYSRFEQTEHAEQVVLDFARCQRCHRPLTANAVYTLGGRPYGPTCIGYVDPSGQAELVSLAEWLASHPEIRRHVTESPAKLVRFKELSLWPEVSAVEGVSDHQREELSLALASRVGILGGSPGTGKTWTVAALIKAIHRSGLVSLDQIAIGAPTGKAAVRLTESLSSHGLSVTARTWHSLLGVGKKGDGEATEWSFRHGEKEPWPYRVIIGDETSMPPLSIMASIFKARAPGCHALFVGDVNQLPPIGNGAPFRDAIAAGLSYGELREIQRNSGGIVEACAAIRDGLPWVHDYTAPGKNLWITGDATPAAQKKRIVELIADSGVDPVWDCQVLTAVNQRSEVSRDVLNAMLQSVLNPSPEIPGSPFREGDKVVCLSNGWFTPVPGQPVGDASQNDSGEVYVANGEVGRVESIEQHRFLIRLDTPERFVVVPRGKREKEEESGGGTGCNWDLAYAMSVHKFQGSEQKVIIGVLDPYPGARMLCDRAWLYTLISRARNFGYLVGRPALAEQMCRVSKMSKRKTFLADKIRRELLELRSEGL